VIKKITKPVVATKKKLAATQTPPPSTIIYTTSTIPDWMKHLNQSLPLNQIAIPGTHDSGTYGSGCSARDIRAQSRNITQQLNDGIRYFDFRGEWAFGQIYYSHGGSLCGEFQYGLDDIQVFLGQNPSEIVVIKLRSIQIIHNYDQNILNAVMTTFGVYMMTPVTYPNGNAFTFGDPISTILSQGCAHFGIKCGQVIVAQDGMDMPSDTSRYPYSKYFHNGGSDAPGPFNDIQISSHYSTSPAVSGISNLISWAKVNYTPVGVTSTNLNVLQAIQIGCAKCVMDPISTDATNTNAGLKAALNTTILPPPYLFNPIPVQGRPNVLQYEIEAGFINVVMMDWYQCGNGNESAAVSVLKMNSDIAPLIAAVISNYECK